MSQVIFQVDAFTDKPFSGNPAAICLLKGAAEADWMQAVAQEMNLSETAFLHPVDDGFNLRWFTPRVEVELCGHATLATAHVLFGENYVEPNQEITFLTKSGALFARTIKGMIELDFPLTKIAETTAPQGMLDALGIKSAEVFMAGADYLVVVSAEKEVRKLDPDFALLTKTDVRGVIVTAAGVNVFDFVSRFFAPAAGINEDPVTGSAHCALAPFWMERLGKNEMTGFQASQRGGVVKVRVERGRCLLQGKAVTVMQGKLIAQA